MCSPQALQYLRRLCSHPLLVLDRSLPAHAAAVAAATGVPADEASWPRAEAALRALHHAPKLAALRQLLQACFTVSECEFQVQQG